MIVVDDVVELSTLYGSMRMQIVRPRLSGSQWRASLRDLSVPPGNRNRKANQF